MDANALFQAPGYFPPQMQAFVPFVPVVDPGAITNASEATGLPEWAIVGGAVALVVFAVMMMAGK